LCVASKDFNTIIIKNTIVDNIDVHAINQDPGSCLVHSFVNSTRDDDNTETMLSWLKKANPSLQPPTFPGLPNPADTDDPHLTAAVNKEVEKAMREAISRKRKRGSYGQYTPETRAKIAKLCIEIGPKKAAEKMSKEVGKQINESTARSIKRSYEKEVKRQGTNDIASFPRKNVGKPLKLGDLDADVQKFIRNTRDNGGVVNRCLVMSTAKGIVLQKDCSLLSEFGGPIEITQAWANSFLNRMNYVQRKGTKAARKLPTDYEETRDEFYARIQEAVRKHNIPADMIVNWDQTGVPIVPVGGWTLEEAGSRQVAVVGLEDKRQITALLTISLAGELLPPQVLYQGKTEACHPNFPFPEEWDVHHTPSHWSTEESMKRYVDTIISPYMAGQRERLGLQENQKGLAIFDVYKAQRTESVLTKLQEANVIPVFVPASCTGELQPLDADGGLNDALKKDMKSSFMTYYAESVAKEIEQNTIDDAKVDLRLSTLKPLHANWLLGAMDRLGGKKDLILRGWQRTGIQAAVEKVR